MAPQREWFDKDYYATLGVAESATPKDVTTAYRKLARKYHPDANPGNASAEEKFKEVSAAYDVLGDETKRSEYDEVRRAVKSGGFGPGGPGAPGGPGGGFGFGAGGPNITDLLGDLFGQRGPSASEQRRRPQGTDLETEMHISLLDAARGVTTSLTIPSQAQCPDCAGSGAALGTQPRTCDACHGKGTTQENQGLFGFSRPCSSCSGRGKVVDRPCLMCNGAGTVSRPEEVRLRIPEGFVSEKVMRVAGKGAQSPNGARGDLYVRIFVEDDPRFSRDGNDLKTTVPVLFTEAALGADISVRSLEGDPVTIRIPAGTRSGKTFRLRGRGMPHKGGKGDLLVTTNVVVPAQLSSEQREALEAFAAVYNENPRS